jgi:hypothetical protein
MVSAAPASGLPSGAELRTMERLARQASSGIRAVDLEGCWLLDQVWPQRSDRPAMFSNALLRGLGARLEISPLDRGDELSLSNAVRLGALELRFQGRGGGLALWRLASMPSPTENDLPPHSHPPGDR